MFAVEGSMNKTFGYLLIVFGSFVSALHVATLYPNPNFNASWTGVVISLFIMALGISFVRSKI